MHLRAAAPTRDGAFPSLPSSCRATCPAPEAGSKTADSKKEPRWYPSESKADKARQFAIPQRAWHSLEGQRELGTLIIQSNCCRRHPDNNNPRTTGSPFHLKDLKAPSRQVLIKPSWMRLAWRVWALLQTVKVRGWLREPGVPNDAEEGAHHLPTRGKMILLGPGLSLDSRGIKRRLAPPPALYKPGHVERIQHRAQLPQIPDRTVYTPRTGGSHREVGMGTGSFEREKQKWETTFLFLETAPESRGWFWAWPWVAKQGKASLHCPDIKRGKNLFFYRNGLCTKPEFKVRRGSCHPLNSTLIMCRSECEFCLPPILLSCLTWEPPSDHARSYTDQVNENIPTCLPSPQRSLYWSESKIILNGSFWHRPQSLPLEKWPTNQFHGPFGWIIRQTISENHILHSLPFSITTTTTKVERPFIWWHMWFWIESDLI